MGKPLWRGVSSIKAPTGTCTDGGKKPLAKGNPKFSFPAFISREKGYKETCPSGAMIAKGTQGTGAHTHTHARRRLSAVVMHGLAKGRPGAQPTWLRVGCFGAARRTRAVVMA